MSFSPYETARVLSEALPHMQQYDDEIVVVKYGGHAMGEENLARQFARDIVLLEQTAINPVVVHGGGPQIEAMLKRVGVQSQFTAGLRITDAATLRRGRGRFRRARSAASGGLQAMGPGSLPMKPPARKGRQRPRRIMTNAASASTSQETMRIVPPVGAAIGNSRCPANARMETSPANNAPPST